MDHNEVNKSLSFSNAYDFIEAIRSGVNVSALGLGVTGNIEPHNSLYTVITIESFCVLLNLIVLGHEISKFKSEPEENKVGRSIYLSFRLAAAIASIAGISLIGSDLAMDKSSSSLSLAGSVLIAVGLFSSHALSISKNNKPGANQEQDSLLNAIDGSLNPQNI